MRHYTESEYRLAAELSPTKVCDYLAAKGYACADHVGTIPVLFCVFYQPGNTVEVPLNPALADYGRRMVEALDAIGEPFLGLLHAIDPDRFPRERILVLVGVTA